MRIRYATKDGSKYGELVGLLRERDIIHAIIRLDGHGLMLTSTHPSTVTPVDERPEPEP